VCAHARETVIVNEITLYRVSHYTTKSAGNDRPERIPRIGNAS